MNIGAFPSSPTTTHHQRQSSPPSHITATNLARLLSRLDQKLGFVSGRDGRDDAPLPLALERAKMVANLEYARNLLLTLEKEAETIGSVSQRQKTLTKLGQQKQAVRRLNEKLQISAEEEEAENDGDGTDNDMHALNSEEDEDEDENEDGDVSPAGMSSAHSLPESALPSHSALPEPPLSTPIPSATTATTALLQTPTVPAAAAIDAPTLRHRFPQSHHETRAALFNNRGTTPSPSAELQLDSQRAEQEDLTSDMLNLALALKQNSLRFSEELQKEKGLLDLAAEGLDKNTLGIEGAGRKMGQLRGDGGVGWMWGILYPVVIVVLAFFTLFVLFFAPKLRW